MSLRGKRPFYLLSLSLAIAAILAAIVAQRCAARAAAAAASATATDREEDRKAALNESEFSIREHGRIFVCAVVVLSLGVASWLSSLHRGEPGRQSVPMVLVSSAAIVQLLLV